MMKRIENKEKVNSIEFVRSIQPYCPLGNDYYNAEIRVYLVPDKYYPDYCEADEAIKALSGKEYTIEQLAAEVFEIIQGFEPQSLTVEVEALSNTHFPVIVTKTK